MRRTYPSWGLPGLLAVFLFSILGPTARAADDGPKVWLQIEAQPTLAGAQARASAYGDIFPDVAGFLLASGWHAIVIGPSPPEAARDRLRILKRDRMIPADSFIADGRGFRGSFWPPAEAVDAPPPAPDPVAAEPAASSPVTILSLESAIGITDVVSSGVTVLSADSETPDEARATEAALTEEDRKELQLALGWFGHYDAAIDGSIGRGSRAAMAAWQEANAAEPTGVLTTAQRRTLLDAYRRENAALGLAPVREAEAGIQIDLPLALVRFDRYEPPFALFEPLGDSGVRVLLISQPGDRATLTGLEDRLLGLGILPPGTTRERDETSFTLGGRDDRVAGHARAELSGGLVKGYAIVWPHAAGDGFDRVLAAMQASFRGIGARALDPGLAPLPQADRDGLLAGLEPPRPVLSRSGFFVDAGGTVLTTPEVQAGCSRITIDGTQEMDVALDDPDAGLLVLSPRGVLAPAVHARFRAPPTRIGTEVAVAGYSYEDALPAPAMTFGRIAALQGLEGEPGVKRLDLAALPGDAGGPVVDGSGAVIGMLLPSDRKGARLLPEGVAFAATFEAIATRLGAAGLRLTDAAATGILPPDDLARRARGMTVLVSCWD